MSREKVERMKRIKMQDRDIYNLNSHYHNFYRVSDKTTGTRGTAFVFDKLTQNDISIINSFKNTIISTGTYKYAQEIKNVRVIVLDKCIKKSEAK